MKFSKKEQDQLKVRVVEAENKELRKSPSQHPDFYEWLPEALKRMSRSTFEQRIRSGFGTLEECATKPVNKNKSTVKGRGRPISEICDEHNIPRVSFYKWRKRQENAEEIAALDPEVQVKMYVKVRSNP